MSPLLLAALAAVVAFAGAALAAGEGARAWRLAAALAVALVGLGVSARAPGGPGRDLVAEARGADGAAVHTTVVLQRSGARRQVRQVPLQRPLGGTGFALLAMVGLGLVGAGLSQVRRPGRLPALGAALPVAGAGLALALAAGVGEGGSGAEAVRAFLLAQGAEDLSVTGFTVPEGSWRFGLPAATALGFAAVLGAVGAVSAVRPGPARALGTSALAVGALGILAALAWRLAQVGGLPWRGPELALLAAAALMSAAWATGAGGSSEGAKTGEEAPWAPAILAGGAVAVLALGVG